MLKVIQRASKHCTYHLQDENLMFTMFFNIFSSATCSSPTEQQPVLTLSRQHYQIQLSCYYPPNTRLPKTPKHYYIFTLKTATAMCAETSFNFQQSIWLIPGSRICTYFILLKLVSRSPLQSPTHLFTEQAYIFRFFPTHSFLNISNLLQPLTQINNFISKA